MNKTREKIPVVAVVGPTASGKTALGIALARRHNGEIVSADSMQIYKGLDIATAKPTAEELAAVPHHLISLLPRTASCSVVDYVKLAQAAIEDIRSRGKLPILVGGTGLYASSLLEHIQFSDVGQNPALRAQLTAEAETQGKEALFARLQQLDPETAASLHANNLPRVIRALEVYMLTGRPLSAFKAESRQEESPYACCWLGLCCADRALLYERVNTRVDAMLEEGLVEEARAIYKQGEMQNAAKAIGYKELIPFFSGTALLADCVEKIKLETRRYAKRQLTWFRRNEQIQWILSDKFDRKEEILEECEKKLAKSSIL